MYRFSRAYLLLSGIPALLLVLSQPLQGQLIVKLDPKTVEEFDAYTQRVESELQERWQGKKNFLAIEDDVASKRNVLGGEFVVRCMTPDGHPQAITAGLVHDWAGTVYLPKSDVSGVMHLLRDFDSHKTIYPEVADSRTVRQGRDDTVGYWRVQQRRGVVPVVLEIEQEAHYKEVSPGKWICRAYAKNIREVDTGLFSRGRKFPPGEGHGYMWRLYAYWSLEIVEGGVLAECRTVSLSRDIPQGLSWAIEPYVQKMPEESLTSTLRETRKALSKAGQLGR